ncbi:MAG TPA: hypothetical protein VFK79_07510 [Xanthobacteraceae bacterium]|nr:hypothetical protein [Xanthobacteraceae bacterium]
MLQIEPAPLIPEALVRGDVGAGDDHAIVDCERAGSRPLSHAGTLDAFCKTRRQARKESVLEYARGAIQDADTGDRAGNQTLDPSAQLVQSRFHRLIAGDGFQNGYPGGGNLRTSVFGQAMHRILPREGIF